MSLRKALAYSFQPSTFFMLSMFSRTQVHVLYGRLSGCINHFSLISDGKYPFTRNSSKRVVSLGRSINRLSNDLYSPFQFWNNGI